MPNGAAQKILKKQETDLSVIPVKTMSSSTVLNQAVAVNVIHLNKIEAERLLALRNSI
jgi:hypothetical protein